MHGSCLLNYSATLHLLIGAFNPFIFKVIVGRYAVTVNLSSKEVNNKAKKCCKVFTVCATQKKVYNGKLYKSYRLAKSRISKLMNMQYSWIPANTSGYVFEKKCHFVLLLNIHIAFKKVLV